MARKPNPMSNPQRDARQKLIDASPLVNTHSGIEEVHVEMTFSDPEGKQKPSPRGAIYAPDMHAFFHFSCPLRDCVGGGFDANADLTRALSRKRSGHTGTLSCEGMRSRSGLKATRCDIQLHYTMALRGKSFAAA